MHQFVYLLFLKSRKGFCNHEVSQRLSAVARQREGGGFDSQGLYKMVDETQTDGHPTSANMKGCAECRGSCRALIGSSRLSQTENICGSKTDECVIIIIIIFEFFFPRPV